MRFYIRDILWITLAIGIALGWRSHVKTYESQIRVLKSQQNHALLEQISQDEIRIHKLTRQLTERENAVVQLNKDKEELRTWHRDWINVGLRQEAEIDRLNSELKKATTVVEKQQPVTDEESARMREHYQKLLTEEVVNYKRMRAAELLEQQQLDALKKGAEPKLEERK